MEWNPVIRDDAQVYGVYQTGTEMVSLGEDKKFMRNTAGSKTGGTWERQDHNLYLTDSATSHTQLARFIQYRSINYIMLNPPEDPDMWDGELGLKQRYSN